jgi:dTDP-4-amino-4,6-dideoxygalactose transaminase
MDLKGEVILPAMTFVATAHALKWQEITPVFCDIDPVTLNIDPKKIEALITPKTSAIIGVHLWGRPCEIEALEALAKKHKLKLLFDAAHAFGCTHNGRAIGNFGSAEVFSFHATKVLNTFEGGAIATNDDALAEKIRLMQNFGFSGYDNVVYIGTNGKMSEVSAAMGLSSLESLDEFIRINKNHYQQYQKELAGVNGVQFIPYNEKEKNNYHYVIIQIDKNKSGLTRDELMKLLWAENVRVRRYFFPGCHRMEPYRSLFPNAGKNLQTTESICDSVLALPTGSAVTSAEISAVSNLIRFVIEHAAKVHPLLEKK